MYDGYSNNQATTPSNPPTPQRVVRFDGGYVKTLPGVLKLVELVCNFVGFICIKISSAWVSAVFYNIVYWVGIAVTSLLLIAYTLHIVEKYSNWPWLKFEFCYCGLISLVYIGTSIFAATVGESAGYAVGIFGFFAIISYGLDGFLRFRLWRRGLPPQ